MRNTFYLLFILFTTFSLSLKAQNSFQLVFSETTAEAINELNKLVPDYNERRDILLKMKEMEKKGMVFISSDQYEPIKARIISVTENPQTSRERENLAYKRKVNKRYRTVSQFVNECKSPSNN